MASLYGLRPSFDLYCRLVVISGEDVPLRLDWLLTPSVPGDMESCGRWSIGPSGFDLVFVLYFTIPHRHGYAEYVG